MPTLVHCDRCQKDVPGSTEGPMSAGVYVVTAGSCWHRFAKPGEQVICDACMWTDPDYISVYGKQS